MQQDDFSSRPTMADDIRLGVDDAEVIASTLPPAPMRGPAERLRSEASHAMECTRGFVEARPVQSMLVAALSGAALAAGLLAVLRPPRF